MHITCKLKTFHILILQQEPRVKIIFTVQRIKITDNVTSKCVNVTSSRHNI